MLTCRRQGVLPLRAARCLAAFPRSRSSGLPAGVWVMIKSGQKTPCLKPVPRALEQASLAAKRRAAEQAYSCAEIFRRLESSACSSSENILLTKRWPNFLMLFFMRSILARSLPDADNHCFLVLVCLLCFPVAAGFLCRIWRVRFLTDNR